MVTPLQKKGLIVYKRYQIAVIPAGENTSRGFKLIVYKTCQIIIRHLSGEDAGQGF